MKTVLIVEDEKMIRQGIRAMIQRSGVPVENIMECNNGEMALAVLKDTPVDVMFTDIRMPKMDGITLVKEVSKLPQKPLVVAVSGYDDFSYAVEMLREGVREYLLKPVERDKIKEVLEKLEAELSQREKAHKQTKQIETKQMKLLLATEEEVTSEEMDITSFEQYFTEGFYIYCVPAGTETKEREGVLVFPEVWSEQVLIVDASVAEMIEKNELGHIIYGRSDSYTKLTELQKAHRQAHDRRKEAFCIGESVWTNREYKVPDDLEKEAHKLLDKDNAFKRMQLVGADKPEDLRHAFHQVVDAAEKNLLPAAEVVQLYKAFYNEFAEVYRNVLQEEQDKLKELQNPLSYVCLDAYDRDSTRFLLQIQEKIQSQYDSSQNNRKMQKAVEYIRENYAKDLNMAVVSNYISMNYSLFSYSFKQFTGMNFVGYLKNIRMDEAKKLLAETELKVNEISQQVGYDNVKHFMKTFKAMTGVAPSEFRKNAQIREEA